MKSILHSLWHMHPNMMKNNVLYIYFCNCLGSLMGQMKLNLPSICLRM